MEGKTIVSQNDYALNTFSEEHFGKSIIDSYGWTIGKIIGVFKDSQKNKSFVIELNSGGLMNCEESNVRFSQNIGVMNNSWRTKAESLTSELILISKKISVLDELKKNTEISEEQCDNIKKEFESQKKIFLEKRRVLLDKLKDRMEVINSQLEEIYMFDTETKISHRMGDIGEEVYQNSQKSIKLMIEKLLSEENDIKFSSNLLNTSLSTLPSEPIKVLPPSTPSQPSTLRVKVQ